MVVPTGRLTGQYPLMRQVAGRATPGSDGWCATQNWLGMAASGLADLPGALGHFTVVCDTIGDRGASRLLVHALTGRAWNLTNMGRTAEAAEVARGALAMAREARLSRRGDRQPGDTQPDRSCRR